MNNLQILNQQKAINSREVAEMMGIEHKYVLRYIDGAKEVVGIKETLESAGLHSQNYFIPSTYRAGTREHQLLIKIHERNYTIEEWKCKRCYKFIEI